MGKPNCLALARGEEILTKKKQITWLNNNGKHHWFNPNDSFDDIKGVL